MLSRALERDYTLRKVNEKYSLWELRRRDDRQHVSR